MSHPFSDAIVVVHIGDRALRTACAAALRHAGVRTRLSSRPAELAKSLADGLARAVIAGPSEADRAAVSATRPVCPVISTIPDETSTDIVRRVLALLAPVPVNQVTSSE